ncbi:hypothetical protein FB639_000539 [Coemansia asiatica]|nr:hypothetical protein FB639_000539 [Coemansia asiatica]
MIVNTLLPDAPKTQEAIGEIDLACSLIRSRQIWLTEAFSLISEQNNALPRSLIDTVEVQIGPHIFANTKFYLIAPPDAQTQPRTNQNATDLPPLPPPLAFEFSEAPGDLLCLPKDFGIDRAYSGKIYLLCYFYAHPTNSFLQRSPSLIRQHWPHYYSAEKRNIRINLVIRGASDQLIECLLDYADAHRTTVWRQCRQTLCHPHPTAKFYDDFLPARSGKNSKISEENRLIRVPSILKPQPSLDNPRMNHKEQAAMDQVPISLPAVKRTGGGKSGYNLEAARLNMEARRIEFKFESENELSDVDAKAGQSLDSSEQEIPASKIFESELESEPEPSLDPPKKTKAKRPMKRGPYKRRALTNQKPRLKPKQSALVSVSVSSSSASASASASSSTRSSPLSPTGSRSRVYEVQREQAHFAMHAV